MTDYYLEIVEDGITATKYLGADCLQAYKTFGQHCLERLPIIPSYHYGVALSRIEQGIKVFMATSGKFYSYGKSPKELEGVRDRWTKLYQHQIPYPANADKEEVIAVAKAAEEIAKQNEEDYYDMLAEDLYASQD